MSEVSITANGDTYHILRDPSGQATRDVEMTWPASGERVRHKLSSTAVFEGMFSESMRWQADPEMVADYNYRMEVAKWTGIMRGVSGGAGLMLGAPRTAAQVYMEGALTALGTVAAGLNAHEQYRAGNDPDAALSAAGVAFTLIGLGMAARTQVAAKAETAALRSGSDGTAVKPAAVAQAKAATDVPQTLGDNASRGMNSSNELMGVEPASQELLDAVAKRRTVKIVEPGTEELRYLDYIGAEANVGGENMDHILLRPNPSKAALLEEFLHGTQHKVGLIDRIGIVAAEAHVKDFMIRHRRMLGLGDEDVRILQILKDAGL